MSSPSPVSAAMNCATTSTGTIAITDLGSRKYRGEQGGLYPGGSNIPPPTYRTAGIRAANAVVPLDKSGKARSSGSIVFISLGMSNTSMEFSYFARSERTDSARSSALALVDGAQGGEPASSWTSASDPTWGVVDKRLAAAGFTDKQVEVAWLKQADAFPTTNFETYAHGLQTQLGEIISIAAQRFPNLRQVFVSPRTYGGYGVDSANPEPYAYQTGFADKFLIAQWVANPSPRPWVGWGPYFWTDGILGRADGLKWYCSDTVDGTHPSASGLRKLYPLMHNLFATSDFSPWFRPGKAGSGNNSSSSGAGSGSVGGSTARPTPAATPTAKAPSSPGTLGSKSSPGTAAASAPGRTASGVPAIGWFMAVAGALLIVAFIVAIAQGVATRRRRRTPDPKGTPPGNGGGTPAVAASQPKAEPPPPPVLVGAGHVGERDSDGMGRPPTQ